MKKVIVCLLLLILGISKSTFANAPSEWAQEPVWAAVERGFIPGNLPFSQPITRAEFAALAVALYDSMNGDIQGRYYFNDTSDIYVQKAAYLGVVIGVGYDKFDPHGLLTREQAAVMLSRLANAVGHPLPMRTSNFADSAEISPWAMGAVGSVQLSEVMSGVGGNRFAPQDVYTWEQSIVTIMRLVDFIELGLTHYYVKQPTGLFAYMGAATHYTMLGPQRVIVLQAEYNWIQVETWLGPMWIYLNFVPSTAALDTFLRQFGNNVAVFYMNIETGFTYMYNPDKVFFAASVNKIQHALYVYHLAEQGLADLTRMHTYTAADYWGGTGIMRNMPFGRQFSTQELLTMSIRYSDNVAFRMLVRQYGLPGYMEFVQEIGADESLVRNITGSNVTARDVGLWAQAIFEYISSDSEFASTFKYDLMNTRTQFIRANYPLANKHGWATDSFHDVAIVYANSPYILVILSNMSADGGARGTFGNISDRVQDFHRAYF